MPVDEIAFDAEAKMEEAVERLKTRFKAVRSGRASAALVEHVRVEYYGTSTPLNKLANIATPDPRLIVIKPYDPTALKDIEKALLQSDLGLTPQNDGKLIRLGVPPLSEERRKQLAAQVREMGEEAKIAIRQARREAMKSIDKEEKNSELSEDDADRAKDEIQKLTDQYEDSVTELVEKKSEEIMEV